MNDADKTKEQLIQEIELLRTLINALPDRLYVKDVKSRFVICNKAVAEDSDPHFSGDPIGKTDFDLFKHEIAVVLYAREQELIKTGKPIINDEVHRSIRKNGRENWSLCTKLPWRDKNGNIIGIVGANRDITERKIAELALQESETRYKTIFNSATEGIAIVEIETKRFMYANPAICRMFGYTADELTKMTVYDLHPKEHRGNIDSDFASQKSGKIISVHNIHCLRKDGTTFFIDLTTVNVQIDKKACNVGFFTDITRHKRYEEALRESEQKYRLLVEQLPAITYTAAMDKTRTTLYTSPQVHEILGISLADYKAEPDFWLKRLHPEDRRRVMKELVSSHQKGEPFNCEYRMLTMDGRIVWIRDNARIIEDAAGKPIHLQGVMYDITQHRKTEDMLRESEEKFRGLAERSFDMIFITDTKGFITYLSPASERIFGYKPEEMIGKQFLKFLVKSEIPKALSRFNEKLKGNEHGSLNLEAIKKNGSHVFIELNSSLVIENGKPNGTQGIIRDVTAHKIAEEELKRAHEELETHVRKRTAQLDWAVENLRKEIAERKQAEEMASKAEKRFRTIFENTVVGLYRTTPEGKILLANPALIKMMGCKSFEELAKLDVEKKGYDPSTPRSRFKKQIAKKGRVAGLESVWLKPNGTKLYVSESAFAIKDKKGKTLYYEGTVQDISQRKNAEEKLLFYQQQLRSLASQLSFAEEQLRRRIATELHDHIGQNLAISKMKLESLSGESEPKLAKSIGEAIELIAQTIDVTRSLTFEISPPVLYELGFEAAIGWLAKQTRKRFGIEVEVIDDGKSKPLDNDLRVLLFQAVRELLLNIVKHAKATKATVSISRIASSNRKTADFLRIIVEDNGIGFDATRVRDPDYTQGGFGLFNIRERLDYIGGNVDINSRPGHGTKVILTASIKRPRSLKLSKKHKPGRSLKVKPKRKRSNK